MSRILIAGCGYLGTALGLALARQGHEVVALRRSSEGLPTRLVPLAADLCDPATLRRIDEPFDTVYYTAAAERGDDEAYRRAYVEGLANLIDRLERLSSPPHRLFFCSSTRVYPQSGGEWVDEDSPTAADLPIAAADFRSRRLLEGEAVAADASFSSTVVRLAGIYGPGRDRLLRRLAGGAPLTGSDSERYTNRIHLDDCVGLLLHLLGVAQPANLYLGVDSEPSRLGSMERWLRVEFRRERPDAAGESKELRTASTPSSNKRCSNARLVASGYRFRFPTFREGYSALLRDRRYDGTELVK